MTESKPSRRRRSRRRTRTHKYISDINASERGRVPVVANTDYTLLPRDDDSGINVVAAALQFREEDRLAAAAEFIVIHARSGLDLRCHYFERANTYVPPTATVI